MSKIAPAPWMARALRTAGALDVLAGGLLAAAPAAPFSLIGVDAPAAPEALAWRGLGLVVLAGGVGLALAARRPFQHWPMVAASLLGKVLVPLGFVTAAATGSLPWALGVFAVALGALWWGPLVQTLRATHRAHRVEQTPPVVPLEMALSLYQDEQGTDLLEASRHQPQFLVFLRHFGCTFCREALSDLSTINDRLSDLGTRLVLVHMSTESEACDMFDRHGLPEVTAVSDPDRVLYRAFALRRGTPAQLYGWSVWKRGWEAGVKNKHGIGWLRGDSAQMPGAFVVSSGRVVAQFVHETAADRPDYVDVASEGADAANFEGELEHAGVGGGFREQLRALLSSDAGSEG
ncbi:MAG: peroxiredoxin-like family protein [Planctomycetota bacterium]